MDSIFVHSFQDDAHTHKEDYKIASVIAQSLGFSLNAWPNLITGKSVPFSLQDSLKCSLYCKNGTHKQMHFKSSRDYPTLFTIGGAGGECLRSYWNMNPDDFIKKSTKDCFRLPADSSNRYAQSTRIILERSFEKLKVITDGLEEKELTEALYRESRCRFHFGRDMVDSYFANDIKYSPLIDDDIYQLDLKSKKCPDRDLFMAIVFDRYQPELLNFDFEGGRKIASETIEYAKEINKKYPRSPIPPFKEEPMKIKYLDISENTNFFNDPPNRERIDVLSYIKDLYPTVDERILWNRIDSNTVYDYQYYLSNNASYHPLQYLLPIFAGTSISSIINGERTDIIDCFSNLEQSRRTYFDETALQNSTSKKHSTAKINVSFHASEDVDIKGIELISVEGGHLRIRNTKNGFIFQGYSGSAEFSFKANVYGKLKISLRSLRFKTPDGHYLPIFIDYSNIFINNTCLSENIVKCCHKKPFVIEREMNPGEIITLSIDWKPHNPSKDSTTTDSEQLKISLKRPSKDIKAPFLKRLARKARNIAK